jgi:hypothetical protein
MRIFIEMSNLPHGALISLLTLEHPGGIGQGMMMTYFLRNILAFLLSIVLSDDFKHIGHLSP